MDMEIEGKCAFATGSSSGICATIAQVRVVVGPRGIIHARAREKSRTVAAPQVSDRTGANYRVDGGQCRSVS